MFKSDLWCGYCGKKDFTEIPDLDHFDDSRYSKWECNNCYAGYELNEGYGYYTSWPYAEGFIPVGDFSLNTGELMDDSKLPRTPEGIMRNSFNQGELLAYLKRTQVK